ncbi:MAG: mechanosensitive ion channel family protein [Desulfobacteraceae bacterium]|nr:mechanosensitive ion channel family protein [Desulfobacteraceae bacterium]
MPYCNRTFLQVIILTIIILILTSYSQASQESKSTPNPQSDEKNVSEKSEKDKSSKTYKSLRPIHTDRLDLAGEKINHKIEGFAQTASKYFGNWISKEIFAGISLMKLVICCFLLIILIILERVIRIIVALRIKRIPVKEGEISWARLSLRALLKPLTLFIWVYGIYACLSPLYPHFKADDGSNLFLGIIKSMADIGGTIALFLFLFKLVELLDVRLMSWARATKSTLDDMLVPLVGKALRALIVIMGAIMIMQNLTGIKFGPLIASLGIGGFAVALAAKDTIANFFGTLTILFDKPFQAGERVAIANYDGTVECVGFRSTRIRLLNGHLVSIPNERVVNSILENIGQRKNIRWKTNIGLPYDTPHKKASQAVEILRKILDNHEGMDPDFPPRVYFNGFGDVSLNISVIAWYHPPDYWTYKDWLQKTCLQIMHKFKSAGIQFAFPSKEDHLETDEKHQFNIDIMDKDKDRDSDDSFF